VAKVKLRAESDTEDRLELGNTGQMPLKVGDGEIEVLLLGGQVCRRYWSLTRCQELAWRKAGVQAQIMSATATVELQLRSLAEQLRTAGRSIITSAVQTPLRCRSRKKYEKDPCDRSRSTQLQQGKRMKGDTNQSRLCIMIALLRR
jgi:hypothetical protein